MSGLLDTLLDAAKGRAAVAVHRPYARFEPTGIVAGDIEWREERDGEPAAGFVRPEAPAIHAAEPAATLPQERPERPAEAGVARLLPITSDRPMTPPSSVSSPVTNEGSSAMSKPRMETAAEPEPRPQRGAETVRQDSVLLPPQTAAAAERRFEPLLPPQETTQTEAQTAGPEVFSPEPGETILRSDAGFTLRIGRIEVRTAAQTAERPHAQPAARSIVTRPVALPRASVRQSLDDYRASRKR